MARAPKPLNEAALDEASKAMIYEGAGITQLSRLFGIDAKRIPAMIRHVKPCGERKGYPIYSVREVAPALARQNWSAESIITALRKMNPQDLPPLLIKEFWNGARARLAFERDNGELWPTGQVVEYLGEVLQILRLTWMTLPDDVERLSSLTDKQRADIRRLGDAKMEEIRVALTERFHALADEERAMGADPLAGEAPFAEDAGEGEGDI